MQPSLSVIFAIHSTPNINFLKRFAIILRPVQTQIGEVRHLVPVRGYSNETGFQILISPVFMVSDDDVNDYNYLMIELTL